MYRLRLVILLLLLSPVFAHDTALQGRKHEDPKRLPEERAADTYSVYAAALRLPIPFGLPFQGAKYYIVDSAMRAGIGWQRDNCFQPPEGLRAKVKEMLDDLSLQPITYALEPRFKLDKPYQLVKSGHDVPRGEYGFAFGIVSFSKNRSLASVVVWSSCGQSCGGSQWKVFTRGKNGWEEQPWSRCGQFSDLIGGASQSSNLGFDSHAALSVPFWYFCAILNGGQFRPNKLPHEVGDGEHDEQ